MTKPPKRPRDPNQLAKTIIGIAIGEQPGGVSSAAKDPTAVEIGRKGGLKGGKARSAALTKERRSQIARAAAQKRWENS